MRMIGVEPEEAHLPTQPERPLDLDPARVVRAERSHYAIIDIGSNSVRLIVYDWGASRLAETSGCGN